MMSDTARPKGQVIPPEEARSRLAVELPSWRFEEGGIQRRFTTADWRATMMLVNAIAHLADAADHHPDLKVGYAAVTVFLVTHDAGGITAKDFDLARKIDEVLAWRHGAGEPT